MAHNALYFRLLTPPHSPNQPSQHVNSRPQRPNRRQRPPPLRIIAPRPRLNVTNRQNEQTNETIPTYAHPLPPDHLLNNHNNHLPHKPLHPLRKSKSNDSLEKAYQEKPALLTRPSSRHNWDDAISAPFAMIFYAYHRHVTSNISANYPVDIDFTNIAFMDRINGCLKGTHAPL